MLSLDRAILRSRPIAVDSRSESLASQINAFREREPDPFSGEPAAVEAYVREADALLRLIDENPSAELSESQLRFVRETSMRAVRFARARLDHDRAAALDILSRLFRLGTLPRPDGFYDGELIGVSTGLLSDPFFEWMTRIYQPWRGKTFDAATGSGDNIFADNAWSLATGKLGWPEYRIPNEDPAGTVRVFPFHVTPAQGIEDAETQVLRIVYADAPNPLPVKRVVDEMVELPGGYLLGKVHMRGIREFRRVCLFGLVKHEPARH